MIGRGRSAAPVCLALACLGASGVAGLSASAQAGDGSGLYEKRDTWAETMLASRTRYLSWREGSGLAIGPWYTTDPFNSPDLNRKFPPEDGVDLGARKPDGNPLWRKRPDWVDGKPHHFEYTNVVMTYIYRTIAAPDAVTVTLDLGSDDGCIILLNGKQVFRTDARRAVGPNQDKARLELRKGENSFLMKITNSGGGNTGFYFSLPQNQAGELWASVERDFPREAGWMRRDAGGGHLSWFDGGKDVEFEKSLMNRAIGEMGQSGAVLRREVETLERARARPDDPKWLDLYVKICRCREGFQHVTAAGFEPFRKAVSHLIRAFPSDYPEGPRFLERLDRYEKRMEEIKCEIALGGETALAELASLMEEFVTFRREALFANPLIDFRDVVFIKKHFFPPSEGQGNHMCDQYFGFHAIREGGLYVLEDAFRPAPRLRNVLENSVCRNGRFQGKKLDNGGFLSPDLSYDGKQILFAWTEAEPSRYQWSERSTYKIFKVNVDGSGLTQLTDGPWNDFDPCLMPNGRIVFISERRGGYGRCHGRPVPTFTLHTMEDDGSDITTISYHETNEWHPSIDNNGMIIYTRWDYVDRGFNQAHHPWITTPDGRDARAIQGNFAENQGHRPHMEMDLRAIPGSPKYVTTAAGHHAQAYGSLVILDPRVEDDDRMAPLERLTPEVRFPESEISNAEGQKFATAWPLSEDFYLCVHDPDGNTHRGTSNRFGIALIDRFGNRDFIYRAPEISCLSPIPLRARPVPPVVPHQTAVGRPRKMGLRPLDEFPTFGTVGLMNVYDALRPFPEGTVIEELRVIQVLPKTTPHANSPRIGYGDQKNARAILGIVPVDKDGSAHFKLPAGRPVYVQAIGPDGTAIQSMRSDFYVHPGETLMCQGCHNPRHRSPRTPKVYPTAMRRAPSEIVPEVDGTNPFSFPRLVQPVLDRNCVECHVKKGGKAPDLRKGDPFRDGWRWYTSYRNLQRHCFYYNNAVFTVPRTTPGRFGARESRLYQMLMKGHNDVELSKEELHRLVLWLDANCDFFGTYEDLDAQARGEVVEIKLD